MSATFPPSRAFVDSLLREVSPTPAVPARASAEGRQTPATDTSPSGSRGAGEWLVLAVALACVVAFVAWAVVRAHADTGSVERERLDGQSRVVADNVAQQVEGVAVALDAVRQDARGMPSDAWQASLAARLRNLADAIPGLRSMVVLDADGRVAASSVAALLGRDFAERDYFRAARTQADPTTLHVAAPYKTSLGGYTVVVALAMVGDDGRFVGAVAAALEPAYFEVLMASVLYAPDMWISLGHADGKVFVTMPRDPARLDSGWQGELAERLRQPRGHDEALLVDGPLAGSPRPRLTAVRELQPPRLRMDKPLVIAVGRDRAAVFAGWRQQIAEYALLLSVLGSIAALALRLAQRRRAAFEALAAEAAAEREANAQVLDLALRGADIGVWSWDVAADRFVVRTAAPTHLGFTADELADPGFEWRRRKHPDDAARSSAAVDAHLGGAAEAYECEFRVRHKDGSWRWLYSRGRIVERAGDGAPLRVAGTHLDITERKAIEARALRSAQLLARTGELANIGGWELDLATRRVEWTEQVFRIHDLEPGQMPHIDEAISFYAPQARPIIAAAVEAGARHGTPWDLELPFVSARGVPRWVRAQGVAVFEAGRPVRLQGVFQDITQQKTTALEMARLNEQLQRLSTTDPLTEIGNRRLFEQALGSEWARATRRGEAVAILMVDIDHFKAYNDHYGHPAGDACLRRVARLLGEAVRRGGEMVARYGGEEFVLLLPGSDLDEARAVAERCVEVVVSAMIEHRGSTVAPWVTVSIGVASRTAATGIDPAHLVESADAALYRAKRCGRNRIEA